MVLRKGFTIYFRGGVVSLDPAYLPPLALPLIKGENNRLVPNVTSPIRKIGRRDSEPVVPPL
jgi:hypothetical protein